MTSAIPINLAEAIFEPFWDPALSGFDKWQVESGAAYGLRVKQNWCWVEFEWTRRPASGPAFKMSREFALVLTGYDYLLVSITAPLGSNVTLMATTDAGIRMMVAPPALARKRELALPLNGATRLDRLTLAVEAARDGFAVGFISWCGLQNSRLLPQLLRQHQVDECWPKHLQPESFEPQFVPAYGLALTADDLAVLRDSSAWQDWSAPTEISPETMIGDAVNFWGDTRYCRERDHDRILLTRGLNAALLGQLRRDKSLLRFAARCALAIGMCEHWDDAFICRFPGSAFNHRCFVQSLCAYEVAAILDLAGEMFTAAGRDFLLRRLAEEGIGAIQYNTWKYDYIFGCNQLAWFTPGRMLALAVLERHWPRVRAYREIAWQELNESLQQSILPDGGYVEGTTYFRCVGRDAGLGLLFYSRAAGVSLETLVPEAMRRCADFAEVLISTDDQHDMIPICDGTAFHEALSQAIMSRILPGSAWARMWGKTLARPGGAARNDPRHPTNLLDAALALRLGDPAELATPRPFVVLPNMGVLASCRQVGDQPVKLFIMGNQAGAGHTHEDKGSFVLEFAGETFAMDPGTTDYSNPLAGALRNCERHNLLVPVGDGGTRPHPQCPLPADVKPHGSGDAVCFSAEIDATPGWEDWYRKWTRRWESPTPGRLVIHDDYRLVTGSGVDFFWQTTLPVSVDGDTVTITGQRGVASICAPAGSTIRLEELPYIGDQPQRRIAFRVEQRQGHIETIVTLRASHPIAMPLRVAQEPAGGEIFCMRK